MVATVSVFKKTMLNCGNGKINRATHTFKMLLVNAYTFNADHEVYADISSFGITPRDPYPADGWILTGLAFTALDGKTRFDCDDVSILLTQNGFGPFTAAIIYSWTATDKNLLVHINLGQEYTGVNGDQFLFPLGSDGVLSEVTS